MKVNHNLTSRQRRTIRARSKVRGTTERPRLNVFRSNETTYLQVIDDTKGITLAAANAKMTKTEKSLTKLQEAIELAKNLAADLKKKKITKLVFDRGPSRYHGRVKAIADTVRENGIQM
ncbi:MAG TPA: 50S ribosomal protein L18 [Patescibacteria group bacterium]|nr:50S ribosomal protein L18 [Patescibacteria group bacterium]